MTPVWFALAAAAGALTRHGVNRLGHGWRGTLVVNTIGSFLLGALMAGGPSTAVLTVLGTAWCGSLTTFSMFSLEAIEARGDERVRIVVATVLAVVGAAAVGYAVG